MPVLNAMTRTLHCNVCFVGPAFSGKTSVLNLIFTGTPEHARSVPFRRQSPPLVGFYVTRPLQTTLAGAEELCLHLSTIPGYVFSDEPRIEQLTHADALVFVADSAPARMDANVEMLDTVVDLLEGLKAPELPVVMLLNKRDLPDAVPVDLMAKALPYHWGKKPLLGAAVWKRGGLEALEATSIYIVAAMRNGVLKLRDLEMLKMPADPGRLYFLLRSPSLNALERS